jgi:uncharacterized protein (TIGR02246 family)
MVSQEVPPTAERKDFYTPSWKESQWSRHNTEFAPTAFVPAQLIPRGRIKKLAQWMRSWKKLCLMAEDVVFLVPGQEHFGKQGWTERMKGIHVEGQNEIQEITISGESARLRQRLRVTITPADAKPNVLSSHTLTILHKRPDGRWVISREANLLTPQVEEERKQP